MRVYMVASTQYFYLHHRFQKIADQLHAMGVPVTYIEQSYGWRAYLKGTRKGLLRNVIASLGYHLLALMTLLLPVRGSQRSRKSNQATTQGDFEIIEMPLVVPANRFNSAILEKLNTTIYGHVLRRKVFPAMNDGEESVALVDNPLWGIALEKNDFTRVYYDCIDDASLYAGNASLKRFLEYERRLADISDAMFVAAQNLEEHLRSFNTTKPIYRIPNGVDGDWFQKRAAESPQPDDLADIPRPIVGYVGTISEWLGYKAIHAVADALPGISFVFVGPIDFPERTAQLRSSPNIYWLGKKEYRDVPLYVAAFDVCWIPFGQGRIVENTNPIKLFEYFALGKPVVTTPLIEVEQYREQGLVYVGGTDETLIEALQTALGERDGDKRTRRAAVADAHSWKTLVDRMKKVFGGENG